MNSIQDYLRPVGPLIGALTLMGIPALVVTPFFDGVPEPLQFMLCFAALPLGVVLGSLWAAPKQGITVLIGTFFHLGYWTAYHLSHFTQLAYSDTTRLGNDLAVGYFLLAVGLATLNLVRFALKRGEAPANAG